MFTNPFYYSSFKKIVAGFGKLFANLYVIHRNESGLEKERIKVPLAYGPTEKYLGRNIEDPTLDRGYALKLPRMAFQIDKIEYDSARKLNTLKKNIQPIQDSQGNVIRQYQGVPYKIGISLFIMAKYVDDGNQLIEQILPWFTPSYTITINSIPGMNYKDDVPVILTSVVLDDNYEKDWRTRREVIWTLSFEVRTIFYGPIVEKKIITNVQADLHPAMSGQDLTNQSELSNIPRVSRITAEPINPEDDYQDDFGYSVDVEHFSDNKVFNPETLEDEDASVKLKAQSISTSKSPNKLGRPKLV